MTTRIMSLILAIGLLSYLFIPKESLPTRWLASERITINELQKQILERMNRVPEFIEIKKLAKQYGVKEVYIFGGTASAWAHYVQWDLEREKGINQLQPDRFDYDYTSIFRSNQDMDIVIDAPAEVAVKIENAMAEKFPFFQGNQSVWEVRLLNEARGDKDAILYNKDFFYQHSDSHSTGLIEVYGDGKRAIIDVKEPDLAVPKLLEDANAPRFLRDVHTKKLHYYYYPQMHKTTKRFLEGKNPEIFSVVRYLTKAFQYELEIDSESLENIHKVISDFDPSIVQEGDQYLNKWLEKNGPKLFQNAVNVEYAWNKLEELGLRQKLIQVNNNPEKMESLAWWMNKEPLRGYAVGKGSGQTAKELKLDIISHTTYSFDAYESITKSHSGKPNAFISRTKAVGYSAGEAAWYGDGFYTMPGKTGGEASMGRKSGITIQFRILPHAREGSDFYYDLKSKELVIKNKNAIEVIPNSLQVTPLEYFEKIAKEGQIFNVGDLAVRERVRRRVSNRFRTLNEDEIDAIYQIVKTNTAEKWNIFEEWFLLEKSKNYPDIVSELIDSRKYDKEIVEQVLSKPYWADHPELMIKLLERRSVDKYIAHVLALPHWKEHPELVEWLIKKGTVDIFVCRFTLSKAHWSHHPELVEMLIKKGTSDKDIISYILTQPHWKNHPEWVEHLILKGKNDALIKQLFKNHDHWRNHPYFKKLLKNKEFTVENLRKHLLGISTTCLNEINKFI